MNNSMKYILTILISLAIMFPSYSEAASKKQTYHVDDKKLNHKQQREIKRAIKEKKCAKAIDKKSKKVYYVCEK